MDAPEGPQSTADLTAFVSRPFHPRPFPPGLASFPYFLA